MSSLLVVYDPDDTKRDLFGIITGEANTQITSRTTKGLLTQYGYRKQHGNWADVQLVIVRNKEPEQGAHLTDAGKLEMAIMKKLEATIKGFCQVIKHDGSLTICKLISKEDQYLTPVDLDWLGEVLDTCE